MTDRVVSVAAVETAETRGGNTRYLVRDENGNEYSTFRERIGEAALRLEGRRARIEFHEQKRGGYTNVYLDAIELAGDEEEAPPAGEAEEAAWRTAVEAAPWLVGESEPHEEVPPAELFEKLKPFKERVSEDIRADDVAPAEEGDRD
jgi:hypothetical protein